MYSRTSERVYLGLPANSTQSVKILMLAGKALASANFILQRDKQGKGAIINGINRRVEGPGERAEEKKCIRLMIYSTIKTSSAVGRYDFFS